MHRGRLQELESFPATCPPEGEQGPRAGRLTPGLDIAGTDGVGKRRRVRISAHEAMSYRAVRYRSTIAFAENAFRYCVTVTPPPLVAVPSPSPPADRESAMKRGFPSRQDGA